MDYGSETYKPWRKVIQKSPKNGGFHEEVEEGQIPSPKSERNAKSSSRSRSTKSRSKSSSSSSRSSRSRSKSRSASYSRRERSRSRSRSHGRGRRSSRSRSRSTSRGRYSGPIIKDYRRGRGRGFHHFSRFPRGRRPFRGRGAFIPRGGHSFIRNKYPREYSRSRSRSQSPRKLQYSGNREFEPREAQVERSPEELKADKLEGQLNPADIKKNQKQITQSFLAMLEEKQNKSKMVPIEYSKGDMTESQRHHGFVNTFGTVGTPDSRSKNNLSFELEGDGWQVIDDAAEPNVSQRKLSYREEGPKKVDSHYTRTEYQYESKQRDTARVVSEFSEDSPKGLKSYVKKTSKDSSNESSDEADEKGVYKIQEHSKKKSRKVKKKDKKRKTKRRRDDSSSSSSDDDDDLDDEDDDAGGKHKLKNKKMRTEKYGSDGTHDLSKKASEHSSKSAKTQDLHTETTKKRDKSKKKKKKRMTSSSSESDSDDERIKKKKRKAKKKRAKKRKRRDTSSSSSSEESDDSDSDSESDHKKRKRNRKKSKKRRKTKKQKKTKKSSSENKSKKKGSEKSKNKKDDTESTSSGKNSWTSSSLTKFTDTQPSIPFSVNPKFSKTPEVLRLLSADKSKDTQNNTSNNSGNLASEYERFIHEVNPDPSVGDESNKNERKMREKLVKQLHESKKDIKSEYMTPSEKRAIEKAKKKQEKEVEDVHAEKRKEDLRNAPANTYYSRKRADGHNREAESGSKSTKEESQKGAKSGYYKAGKDEIQMSFNDKDNNKEKKSSRAKADDDDSKKLTAKDLLDRVKKKKEIEKVDHRQYVKGSDKMPVIGKMKKPTKKNVNDASGTSSSMENYQFSMNSDYSWYQQYYMTTYGLDAYTAAYYAQYVMVTGADYQSTDMSNWVQQQGYQIPHVEEKEKTPTASPDDQKTDNVQVDANKDVDLHDSENKVNESSENDGATSTTKGNRSSEIRQIEVIVPSISISATEMLRNGSINMSDGEMASDGSDTQSPPPPPPRPQMTTLIATKEITLPNGQKLAPGTKQVIVHPYHPPSHPMKSIFKADTYYSAYNHFHNELEEKKKSTLLTSNGLPQKIDLSDGMDIPV